MILLVLVSMFMYLIFSQVTMRKLRKHPETKDVLGVEFVSGWDSFNVAQALALPQFIINKLKQNPISSLYANTDILNTHTSKIDKAFAYTFYWFFMGSNLFGICVLLLNAFGVFD
ncbi:MAG: hypothetical protein HRT96_08610 [Moritella sp.]|nr:hypothetical protein [Moritella sp.]